MTIPNQTLPAAFHDDIVCFADVSQVFPDRSDVKEAQLGLPPRQTITRVGVKEHLANHHEERRKGKGREAGRFDESGQCGNSGMQYTHTSICEQCSASLYIRRSVADLLARSLNPNRERERVSEESYLGTAPRDAISIPTTPNSLSVGILWVVDYVWVAVVKPRLPWLVLERDNHWRQ